ncbi:hypothetical protein K488DRAFT_90773 [Vararia minispora EC-137]|uniref:Uncharacterized protein n=1 Tax=Vararia minispora EC-137 TaxID=1314806 RepID=A0ACB8Q8J4_9AGAM|nr:hypothetical protein K488DRAFT_90773 [Vararia minispora EC-137]
MLVLPSVVGILAIMEALLLSVFETPTAPIFALCVVIDSLLTLVVGTVVPVLASALDAARSKALTSLSNLADHNVSAVTGYLTHLDMEAHLRIISSERWGAAIFNPDLITFATASDVLVYPAYATESALRIQLSASPVYTPVDTIPKIEVYPPYITSAPESCSITSKSKIEDDPFLSSPEPLDDFVEQPSPNEPTIFRTRLSEKLNSIVTRLSVISDVLRQHLPSAHARPREMIADVTAIAVLCAVLVNLARSRVPYEASSPGVPQSFVLDEADDVSFDVCGRFQPALTRQAPSCEQSLASSGEESDEEALAEMKAIVAAQVSRAAKSRRIVFKAPARDDHPSRIIDRASPNGTTTGVTLPPTLPDDSPIDLPVSRGAPSVKVVEHARQIQAAKESSDTAAMILLHDAPVTETVERVEEVPRENPAVTVIIFDPAAEGLERITPTPPSVVPTGEDEGQKCTGRFMDHATSEVQERKPKGDNGRGDAKLDATGQCGAQANQSNAQSPSENWPSTVAQPIETTHLNAQSTTVVWPAIAVMKSMETAKPEAVNTMVDQPHAQHINIDHSDSPGAVNQPGDQSTDESDATRVRRRARGGRRVRRKRNADAARAAQAVPNASSVGGASNPTNQLVTDVRPAAADAPVTTRQAAAIWPSTDARAIDTALTPTLRPTPVQDSLGNRPRLNLTAVNRHVFGALQQRDLRRPITRSGASER